MTASALPSPRRDPAGRSYRDVLAASTSRTLPRRRVMNHVMVGLTYLAALAATLPLMLILWHLLKEGATSVNWDFFTKIPKPAGEAGGGMANGIVGTGMVVLIASALGLPVGVGAGLYLAEQRGATLATAVRFLSDVLNGLPSIVLGIFAWQMLVRPFKHFSALAGGMALAAMMIPLVTRATEEMIRLVPVSMREAALALGYTKWRTSLSVVLRTALPGIVTGALVAVARIAGETAPLIFTAFGNQFWSISPLQPIAALPMQIYLYAISPYDDWHRQAWAGALVLLALVLVISLAARFATRSRFGSAAIEREVPIPPVAALDAALEAASRQVTQPAARPEQEPLAVQSDTTSAARDVCIDVESLDAYFGAARVVRDVSFHVETGRVTAIIGPSGCGKSTLLRCINRMHETVPGARVEGEVRFQGRDIYERSVSAIGVRRHIGMVFQRPTPFPTMSIRENVAAGLKVLPRDERPSRRETDDIVERALRRAALWDEVSDRLNASAIALSGGQQQRLCIARALATSPAVLLLDEPTASLDPISTQRVEELVYELREQVTIVIVTHNMQQAAHISDRTVFMLSGELVEAGPTNTMFTTPRDTRTEAYITGRFG